MPLTPPVVVALGLVALGVIASISWSVLGWLDRQAGAPVMRERINSGSDKFFAKQNQNWGASVLDSIVRLKSDDGDQDDE